MVVIFSKLDYYIFETLFLGHSIKTVKQIDRLLMITNKNNHSKTIDKLDGPLAVIKSKNIIVSIGEQQRNITFNKKIQRLCGILYNI